MIAQALFLTGTSETFLVYGHVLTVRLLHCSCDTENLRTLLPNLLSLVFMDQSSRIIPIYHVPY